MLRWRHQARSFLGLLAAVFLATVLVILLPARGSATTGITITSGPCSGGGTSFCFNPETAIAETGMTVTWSDLSGIEHEIKQCTSSACAGSPASTGSNTFDIVVPADGHGSFVFSSSGTYYYYCSIHGYVAMHGSIVVTTAATSPPSPSATPKPTPRPTARPTQPPAMRSASATPSRSLSAPPPAHVTPGIEATPTAAATPEIAQSPGESSSPPTPGPQAAITLVGSGGNPALPIALVIALLAIGGAAATLALRRRRQAG
jgi:plastocyanin